MSKKISIISTKNRGMSLDLEVVHKYMSENIKDIEFEYCLGNENSDNKNVALGAKVGKERFSQVAEDVLCIDGSLPANAKFVNKEGKKVLIATPYDFMFKAYNKGAKGKKTFKNFTHVIVNSPFEKELFEKTYSLPKGEIIEGCCSPMAYEINKPDAIKSKKSKFESYFPGCKGKKIMAILFAGKMEDNEHPYGDFDWKALMDSLTDDWFVFTNHEKFFENAVILDAYYTQRVGYVNYMLDARQLLFFADCLVTNNCMFASFFASKNKPIFFTSFKDNGFENFTKKNYKKLWLEDLTQIGNALVNIDEAEQEKFRKNFSYDISNKACEKVVEIFKGE